jgi:hypothetical protein
MRLRSLSLNLAALLLLLTPHIVHAQSANQASQASHPAASNLVACRILEVHANKDPGIVLVIFHQRDKQDQPRFAALLKQSSGGTIQIRPAGAQWQNAPVIRLKSCFGRGMLILPAGTASLKERADVLVKFPDAKASQ